MPLRHAIALALTVLAASLVPEIDAVVHWIITTVAALVTVYRLLADVFVRMHLDT